MTRPAAEAPYPAQRLGRARLAVSVLFLTNGAMFANLLPHYPAIKDGLELSNAAFGVAVAAFPLGAIVAGLASGALVRRFRSSRVATAGTWLIGLSILLAGIAPSWAVLTATLFLAGAMDAITDVAQNSHGLRVQKLYRRSILNSFHAVWSIGAVLGGLMGAAAAGLAVPRGLHLTVSFVLFSILTLACYHLLLPGPEPSEPAGDASVEPGSGRARRRTVTVGILAALVVVGIAFFGLSSPSSFIWTAVVGAGATAVLVYLVGSLGRGGATPLKLALAGAAVSAACSSLVSAVMLPRVQAMDSFRFWQVGGVGGADPARIARVLPFLAVGALISLATARALNAMALGDDLAAGLGERVALTRGLAATGAVLLCGAATAVAGPIGFVGLVVPHACRLVVGSDHRWLMPYAMAVGAALLTLADVLGRVVSRPDEVDVGIVTALVGAPVFIAIVRRQKLRAL